MLFNNPEMISGEHVLATRNISLVIKDSFDLKKTLSEDSIATIATRDPEEGLFGGSFVFFPPMQGSTSSVHGTVDYLPRRIHGSALLDRSMIHASLIQEDVAQPYDIIGTTRADGAPGLSVSIDEPGTRVSIFVGSAEHEQYSTGDIRISLDIPENIDKETAERLVQKTLLVWAAAERGARISRQTGPLKPTHVILDEHRDSHANQLLQAADDYVQRYNDQPDELLPVLELEYDDIIVLNEAYRPSRAELSDIIGSLALGRKTEFEDPEQSAKLDEVRAITMIDIVNMFEAYRS